MKGETEFRKYKVLPFLKALHSTEVFAIQQQTFVGHPDYLLCCNGIFVALELKDEGGKLEPIQEHVLKNISEKAQGVAIVARPSNWEEVKEILFRINGGYNVESYKRATGNFGQSTGTAPEAQGLRYGE